MGSSVLLTITPLLGRVKTNPASDLGSLMTLLCMLPARTETRDLKNLWSRLWMVLGSAPESAGDWELIIAGLS